MSKLTIKSQKGSVLLEIVIASSIISIGLLALLVSYNSYMKSSLNNTNTIKANYLLEEAVEITKIMRNVSWRANISNLANNTDYYYKWGTTTWSPSASIWATTTVPQFVDGKFLRKVTFFPVYRSNTDGKGSIVSSGGNLDTGTKLVNASVAWNFRGATTTKSMSFYLMNIKGN